MVPKYLFWKLSCFQPELKRFKLFSFQLDLKCFTHDTQLQTQRNPKTVNPENFIFLQTKYSTSKIKSQDFKGIDI